jgi:hypothetical protein
VLKTLGFALILCILGVLRVSSRAAKTSPVFSMDSRELQGPWPLSAGSGERSRFSSENVAGGDWYAIDVFMGLVGICCGAAERAFRRWLAAGVD